MERLTHLLALQEQASEQRAALVAEREKIVRIATEDGRDDLTSSEDAEFRRLTAEIADVDRAVEARDALIEPIAALHKMDVPAVELDEEMQRRAAAAEIFTGWREAAPRKRGELVDTPDRRRLTLAQARSITSLETP
jgi:hypothetical protein